MKPESIQHLKTAMIEYIRESGDAMVLIHGKRSYTGTEIAKEMGEETEFGLHMMENMILLTIDLLKRGKVKLPED